LQVPGRWMSGRNAGMTTSAEIRQQLVAALRCDLIGPGWDDMTRRRSWVRSRAWLHHSAVSLPPDLLHKRIGDVIETVAHPHQQIVGEQLIYDRLNLVNPHRPPDRFAIGRCSLR